MYTEVTKRCSCSLQHRCNGLPDNHELNSRAFIQFQFDLRHAGIDELFGGLECCCVLGGSAVILEGREGERKLGEEGRRKGREREGGMKGVEGGRGNRN